MSRRKQQQSRKGRASAIRKIRTDIISQQRIQMKVQKQQCADSNDIIKLNLSHGKMNESIGDKISPPSTGVTTIKSIRSSSNIRHSRRRRLTSPTKTTAIIIPPTTTTSTLPIAIYYYPSTSLFIMLVVASLLPKHTFSLRWLALSGCGVGIGGCVGGSSSSEGIGGVTRASLGLVRRNSGLNNNNNYNRRVMGNIYDDVLSSCQDTIMKEVDDDTESSLLMNRKIMVALWNEVTLVLEKSMMETISTAGLSTTLDNADNDEESQDWSIDSILNSVPRGGGGRRSRHRNNNNLLDDNEEDEKIYAGLINLGNTCYLNAQLQCAYHVPYLRELIKVAKDEIVQVEVEYEVEVDDDDDDKEKEEEETTQVEEEQVLVNEEGVEGNGIDESQQAPESSSTGEDVMNTESSMDADNENVPMLDNELPASGGEEKKEADDESTLPSDAKPKKKKKIIIEKEMKEEIVPISHALQALKVVFNSLTHPSGGGSGSTTVLCRTLGINPYLQQDGQEFWKLFIPELDYNKLAKLYSGYFEDYVREIVPDEENKSGSTMVEEDDVYGEEKKEEDDDKSAALEDGDNKARERVRTEPFLDLSIPVAEGIG